MEVSSKVIEQLPNQASEKSKQHWTDTFHYLCERLDRPSSTRGSLGHRSSIVRSDRTSLKGKASCSNRSRSVVSMAGTKDGSVVHDVPRDVQVVEAV